jgi:mRNA-degrading endonuclease toxin of MazEF toxin-antitoxin module
MCEAVRAVSVERLGRLISTAGSATMAAITDQIILWLGSREKRR